jgi:hypothetical protein
METKIKKLKNEIVEAIYRKFYNDDEILFLYKKNDVKKSIAKEFDENFGYENLFECINEDENDIRFTLYNPSDILVASKELNIISTIDVYIYDENIYRIEIYYYDESVNKVNYDDRLNDIEDTIYDNLLVKFSKQLNIDNLDDVFYYNEIESLNLKDYINTEFNLNLNDMEYIRVKLTAYNDIIQSVDLNFKNNIDIKII